MRPSMEKLSSLFVLVVGTNEMIWLQTQCEAQQAAVQFRRASSFYIAAKETISLAEARLNDSDVEFDEAWQEMLNHSTMKVRQLLSA